MLIGEISVEIQRKPIKNIHIHIKAPEGHVVITAPKRTSDAVIAKIVQERSTWIMKQQQQMASRIEKCPTESVDWDEQRIQLQAKILEYLPKWEGITGLYCSSWQIRKMKTRWGSCNIKTKKIWFNLYLSQTTIKCLEYIILHELLHIKIANHGQEFKANMDKYMPNWREVKKELNQFILF